MAKKAKRPAKRPKKPYRSVYEERIAVNLKKHKRIVSFRYEPFRIQYLLPIDRYKCQDCGSDNIGAKRWYTPDFIIESRKGKNSFLLEAKGKFTAKDRKKILAVRNSNPDLDIRLLFQRDNKIHRNSETRYSEWATRNGFMYDIGESVPKIWLTKLTDNGDETNE
ncbi:MAG: hypothetical protein D6711_03345 [Chloroflexi bacterium]|nr:MAG: hypothetical protein D6711_03345 [Chloroflexota bacterium]